MFLYKFRRRMETARRTALWGWTLGKISLVFATVVVMVVVGACTQIEAPTSTPSDTPLLSEPAPNPSGSQSQAADTSLSTTLVETTSAPPDARSLQNVSTVSGTLEATPAAASVQPTVPLTNTPESASSTAPVDATKTPNPPAGTAPTNTPIASTNSGTQTAPTVAANPNWRPGFTQVPADGSRTASLRDAFTTAGDTELTYTVESSRTVIARARIIGTTARVDGISGGQAEITVTATAPNGASATQTFTVRVREDLQPEPTATPTSPTPTSASTVSSNPNWRPGFTQVPADGSRTASLRDAFTTAGDTELTYTVESSRTVIARARIIGTTARVDGISGGQAEITVTATAPDGATASQSFPVRVREDLQPEPTETPTSPTPTSASTVGSNPNWSPGFTQVPADGSRTAHLSDAFTTAGDTELTYAVASSRTVIARARIIGTTARVDGISGGTATITVTATAPDGATASQSFPVRVREDLQPEPTETPTSPTPTSASTVGSNPNWSPGFTQVPADGSRTASLRDAFTTAESTELTYTVESSRTVIARARIIGTTARVDGISGGQATITVTATAPDGATASQSFQVQVTGG